MKEQIKKQILETKERHSQEKKCLKKILKTAKINIKKNVERRNKRTTIQRKSNSTIT